LVMPTSHREHMPRGHVPEARTLGCAEVLGLYRW
jgi:hypothetical protein